MNNSKTCREVIPSSSPTRAGAEHRQGPWLVLPWAAGGHAALRRKRCFLCRLERRVPPCLAPSLPARAQRLAQAQDSSSAEQGGCWSLQLGKCPPGWGRNSLGGCGCRGVIYSTPSLCPIPRSPRSPCPAWEPQHLQPADTFPGRAVNHGARQRLCSPSASAQLCSARPAKWPQGCWMRPTLAHHPGHGEEVG